MSELVGEGWVSVTGVSGSREISVKFPAALLEAIEWNLPTGVTRAAFFREAAELLARERGWLD